MKLGAKTIVFAAAVLALLVGVFAAGAIEEGHDHEEHSLIEADATKLVVVAGAMTVVAAISAVYLLRKTSSEDKEEEDV